MMITGTTISATGTGNAPADKAGGSIDLTSTALTIDNGKIQAKTAGAGSGGSIQITAPTSVALSNTEVSATATGSGDAGAITIKTAGIFSSDNSSAISSKANTGKGGTITVDGGEKLILDDTTITAEVEAGNKEGGNIEVNAGTSNPKDPSFGNEQILIQNGSTLSAKSNGAGNAGQIKITTPGTLRIRDSEITSDATLASGGNIKLDADFMIHVMDSTLDASVNAGDGGNIKIDPDFVLIQNSILKANSTRGNGGSINIIGDVVLIDSFSRQNISVSSTFGESGTINIESPIQNLSGAIAPLPESIIEVAALYSAQCAGQKGGQFSSFTLQGRDRIPLEPGELLPTPLFMPDLGISPSQVHNPQFAPMAKRLHLPNLELVASFASTWSISQQGCRS